MAQQIEHEHDLGPDANAAKATGTPDPSPPTSAPPPVVAPAVANSAKAPTLADRLADWGLPSVLKGIHHELDNIGKIHKYDWISKRLMVLRNVIFASLVMLATILIVVIAWRELAKSSLVINGFDVPATLEERGYSSRVLGKKLVDQMTLIRSQTLTRLATRNVVPSVWNAGADLAIADSKLTVGAVFAYVRGLLGRDTYVDGELTAQVQDVALTVRIRGKPHKTIVGKIDDLDSLMLKAAEHIMLESHPFIVGQFRYFNKDVAGAMQAVIMAAQSDNPEEVAEALNLWGSLLLAKGDRVGAFAKWEESIIASPKTSRAEENIVFRMLVEGRRDEATKRLERWASRRPNDAYPWGMLGEISIDTGDLAAAERFTQKALAIDPIERVAMNNQGRLLIRRGEYAAALAISERMMQVVNKTQNPQMRSYAAAAQGNALMAMREFERAKSAAEDYIAVDPLGPQGYLRMAYVLNATHDYDQALIYADKGIARGSLHSHGQRIVALIGKGDLDAAQREAESHVKRVPVIGMEMLGIIFLKRNQPALASARFRELIKFSPQNDEGYTGLGRTLALQRDYSAAEEQFKQAIALKSNSTAHFYRGQMLAAKGDHVGAVKKYAEALTLDPKWGEPYAAWGESLNAEGNADAAKEKFAKALELEPKHPDFQKYRQAVK